MWTVSHFVVVGPSRKQYKVAGSNAHYGTNQHALYSYTYETYADSGSQDRMKKAETDTSLLPTSEP